MNDEKLRAHVHRAVDTHCASLASDPYRVQRVMRAAEPEGGKIMSKKLSRFAVVLITLLVLSLSTAIAAGVIHWQRSLEDMLRVSEKTQEYYQHTELFDAPGMSVTHNGVTVTLEESVVDTNAAYLAFRVEGYCPPKGLTPAFATVECSPADAEMTVHAYSQFYNRRVLGADGQPMLLYDQDYKPGTDDNSGLIYTISLYTEQPDLIGRTMTITLADLGGYSAQGYEVQVPGQWTFTWPLKGEAHHWHFDALRLNIGKTGAQVKSVHLSPIHVQMTLDVPLTRSEYEACGSKDEVMPNLYGLKMKDGRVYERVTGAGMTFYTTPDPNGREYQLLFMVNRVIEPANIDSFLFTCPDGAGGSTLEEVPFNKLY